VGEFSLVYGRWCVDYAVVQKFLQGLGMHTRHTLTSQADRNSKIRYIRYIQLYSAKIPLYF